MEPDILPNEDETDGVSTVNPSIPISSLVSDGDDSGIALAKNRLSTALDNLERRGPLQGQNRMDIDTLLNPEGESSSFDEATDVEIYEAEPTPSRQEVVQAALTINRYLNLEDAPFARKLEALIDTFKCDLQLQDSKSLVLTQITDYFTSTSSNQMSSL